MENDSIENWPLMRVYHNGGTQFRHVQELVFLEGCGNYTWLKWRDGGRVLVPYTMKSILASLPATYFMRLHRHFAVNRLFVDGLQLFSNDTSRVCLTTGTMSLPISRRRRRQIHHQLAETMSAMRV